MKEKLVLLFLACSLWGNAQEVRDYVYASDIHYDANKDMSYFDVYLDGDNFYTAYGMDVSVPQGMEINKIAQRGGSYKPNIIILQDGGMYEDEYGSTEHSLTPNFPNNNDFTHARVGCLSNGNYDMGAKSGALFRVYVTSTYTSGWPIGAIKLYAAELAKVGSHHNPQDHETIVAIHTGATELPLNISASNHWSTCILPFTTAIPAGVKAYTSSTSDAESIFLTEANSIEAYTPYILYSENGYNGTVSGTVDANAYPESGIVTAGNLNGAVVVQTVTEGFILQKQNDVVQFYAIQSGDSFHVPAGKCWMNLTGSNANTLRFVVEDEETGVATINASDKSDGIVYDLSGRRVVSPTQKGMYIRNRVKYVSK